MHTQPIRLMLVSVLMTVALAACAPVNAPVAPTGTPAEEPAPAEPSAVPEAPTEEDATTVEGCPPVAEGQTVAINAADGYCFLVPAGYTTGYDLVVYAPEDTEGHRERALIEVTPAAGRSAADVADALVAELPGFEITRSTLELDGVSAEVLDGMPGQDLNRRVIAVSNERVYSIMFVPLAPEDNPAAYAQMEELYALMMESWRFVTPTAAVRPALPPGDPQLIWQGEIDGACHELRLWENRVAQIGVCGDAPSVRAELMSPTAEWEAVQSHFGAIQTDTPHGTITFAGSGDATGAMWANALATWAEFAAMETLAGRPSAAGRTILAWQWSGPAAEPGQCNQLIVLAYGYAYANRIPCEGNGPATLLAQGWLSDEEMTTMTTWTAEHSRVDDEAGYLDATGSAPLTAEEVDTFAAGVYARLVTAN